METQTGQAKKIATSRMAAVIAGVAFSGERSNNQHLCGQTLSGVISATLAVMVGEGDGFIIGGTESMMRAPFVFSQIRFCIFAQS